MATDSPGGGLRALIQPGAVILTALFGIFVYWKKDAPTLEPRSTVQSSLVWSTTSSPQVCRARFDVNLENKGVTAFDVRKVRVRAWQLPDAGQATAAVVFDNVDAALQQTKPITDHTYQSRDSDTGQTLAPPLIARYASGMAYNHTFEWLVPRAVGQRLYVRVDLFRSDVDAVAAWYAGQWSAVCEIHAPAAAAK